MASTSESTPDRAYEAPLLELDQLTVSYGDVVAAQDVSLRIGRGERHAIVGESGSGKTTVCMAVCGFLPRTATISAKARSFRGAPIGAIRQRTLIPARVPGIVTIFQDAMSSLDPVTTIGSQFTAVYRGRKITGRAHVKEQAAEILGSVGLTDVDRIWRSRPAMLSGGMRQRVMIALALAADPALIVADEPTSALDASIARDTMDTLTSLTRRTGASLLIVSHDIALCREYVDHLIVMRAGRIVDSVTPAELEDTAPGSSYARMLVDTTPRLDNWNVDRLPTIDEKALENAHA